MTSIHFSEPIAGLPPEGDEGTFIGFDADDNSYILRWWCRSECYAGMGPDPNARYSYPSMPVVPLFVLCRGNMRGFVVRHVRIIVVSA